MKYNYFYKYVYKIKHELIFQLIFKQVLYIINILFLMICNI